MNTFGLLQVIVATVFLVCMMFCFKCVVDANISVSHSPSWDELKQSYKDFRFTSTYARRMAEKVLEYRMENEFRAVTNNVSLFMNWKGTSPDQKVSFGASLTDCALFTIATAPIDHFSILVYYVPMFNHPRYIECIKAYNESSGTFMASTRDVIIREILTPVKTENSLAALVLDRMTDAELYQLLKRGYVGTLDSV